MGYSEKANSVLFACKNRERKEALHPKPGRPKNLWKWIGLSLLKWTIGYGYGGRYFFSLIWVACLTILGIIVLSTTASIFNIWDKIGFSLDMLLPIIELNEKYKLDFSGWQLYYFLFSQINGIFIEFICCSRSVRYYKKIDE